MSVHDCFRSAIQHQFLQYQQNAKYDKCEDCVILNTDFSDGNLKFLESSDSNDIFFTRKSVSEFIISKQRLRAVIILLESPHVDEYKTKPYYPAKGTGGSDAGRNLHNWLPKLLKALEIEDEVDIYFMNRIQFQTSLGLTGKDIKFDIFTSMWANEEVKESLRVRIKQICNCYDKIDLIDCNTKDLKDFINKNGDIFLVDDKSKMTLYNAYHPSSWRGYEPDFFYVGGEPKKVIIPPGL